MQSLFRLLLKYPSAAKPPSLAAYVVAGNAKALRSRAGAKTFESLLLVEDFIALTSSPSD
jgi:hypothetical protein